ncbi:MAG: DUF366 family protein [Planctomycetota bacterium]
MALVRPQTLVSDAEQQYDGTQLRPHWIFENFEIQGDAAVAFMGPAEVLEEHLVDLADRRDHLVIKADAMLHILVEVFGAGLDQAVLMQRILVLLAREILEEHDVPDLARRGDDFYAGEGKISVSIATVSAVSALIHFGINITNEGTPVRTAALSDFGIDASEFAAALLDRFANEVEAMAKASTKVRPVT